MRLPLPPRPMAGAGHPIYTREERDNRVIVAHWSDPEKMTSGERGRRVRRTSAHLEETRLIACDQIMPINGSAQLCVPLATACKLVPLLEFNFCPTACLHHPPTNLSEWITPNILHHFSDLQCVRSEGEKEGKRRKRREKREGDNYYHWKN